MAAHMPRFSEDEMQSGAETIKLPMLQILILKSYKYFSLRLVVI